MAVDAHDIGALSLSSIAIVTSIVSMTVTILFRKRQLSFTEMLARQRDTDAGRLARQREVGGNFQWCWNTYGVGDTSMAHAVKWLQDVYKQSEQWLEAFSGDGRRWTDEDREANVIRKNLRIYWEHVIDLVRERIIASGHVCSTEALAGVGRHLQGGVRAS